VHVHFFACALSHWRSKPATLGGMHEGSASFPDLPGWRFSVKETSSGVYLVEGRHVDGHSVSCTGVETELHALIREAVENARALAKKPDAQKP